MEDDEGEREIRKFMIQNKLHKFVDAIIDEGWLLEELSEMSSTELQEVADDIKMKRGFATRFKSAVAKLTSPRKCKEPCTEGPAVSNIQMAHTPPPPHASSQNNSSHNHIRPQRRH